MSNPTTSSSSLQWQPHAIASTSSSSSSTSISTSTLTSSSSADCDSNPVGRVFADRETANATITKEFGIDLGKHVKVGPASGGSNFVLVCACTTCEFGI